MSKFLHKVAGKMVEADKIHPHHPFWNHDQYCEWWNEIGGCMKPKEGESVFLFAERVSEAAWKASVKCEKDRIIKNERAINWV